VPRESTSINVGGGRGGLSVFSEPADEPLISRKPQDGKYATLVS
jgi:hypothetical protein